MSTVRRLYFYALALISSEVVLWGVVSLLRTILKRGLVGEGSLLATGLSLVLVGLPIFLLHWRTVQRDALRDPEERASRLRAIFFYAALIATLLPIVSSLLALIDRGLITALGQPAFRAWLGGEQTVLDNVISILINGVVFAYFWMALRADWQSNAPENYLAETRRLYRYLWMIFGLILTVSGVYNLLHYLLFPQGTDAAGNAPILAGGVAMLLVGAPMWAYTWWLIQSALTDTAEQRSLLRLVVLYLISLTGVIGVLAATGPVLSALIREILGEGDSLLTFLSDNSGRLSAAIPLAVMWAYYGQILNREVAAMPDLPRRAALGRLYNYILAAIGLGTTLGGLVGLVDFIAQLLFTSAQLTAGGFRQMISGSVAALLIGLPLWLIPWRRMQAEAARLDDAGDHARRSTLRKAYLYLVLFLLVIGAMGFTGQLLYTLLNAVLSGEVNDLGLVLTRAFLNLVVDSLFLVYHWRALRADGRLAQQSLGNLHAAFPTLVLVEEGNPVSSAFSEAFLERLKRVAPRLPVAVHAMERGAPDEAMLGAKAVLLPVGLALKPSEPLRLWLADYQGQRILVPLPTEGWSWLTAGEKRPQELAREAAQAIRQVAEGEAIRPALPNSPWTIVGYVLGALFGLLLLIVILSSVLSTLFR